MQDALYIAATGMQAQQLYVDTIANNLANVNTAGFKKSRVAFSDMVTGEAARLNAAELQAAPLAAARGLGAGVGVARTERLFDMGDLQQTGAVLDLAIQGAGFLEVATADGGRAFSRGGHLKVNNDGQLVTASGQVLKPGISIPANAKNITISPAGQVRFTVPGHAAPVEAGQLELVRFANPALLQAVSDGLYRATDASGEPTTARAGQDDSGVLVQGAVETSNVKMVDEMVNLMIAQRAYGASVKVLQAADEMLGMINTLRK
ncbi:MAG TPA: flagellar basal-body rod protein FlgG [Ramlibacter sp.]|nr:flagellar basal-body rod protein FlgG [Ramlibacter sp.]